MSEPSNGAWPFQEIPEEEGLDISAILETAALRRREIHLRLRRQYRAFHSPQHP